MPIEKFKTYEAAAQALWCFDPDLEYYRKVAAHFKLAGKLCRVYSKKGVYKYRNISDFMKKAGSCSDSGFSATIGGHCDHI